MFYLSLAQYVSSFNNISNERAASGLKSALIMFTVSSPLSWSRRSDGDAPETNKVAENQSIMNLELEFHINDLTCEYIFMY